MSDMKLLPAAIDRYDGVIETPQGPKAVILTQESDTDTYNYNSKPKTNVQGYMAAGIGTMGVAGTAYKFSKGLIQKGVNQIEKEVGSYFAEIGKNFKGIPNALKVNAKYFGAIAAAIASGLLFFKDSDKDGQLDIFEACKRFANPDDSID